MRLDPRHPTTLYSFLTLSLASGHGTCARKATVFRHCLGGEWFRITTLPFWFEYAGMHHELVEQGWTHIRSLQSTILGVVGVTAAICIMFVRNVQVHPYTQVDDVLKACFSNVSSNCFNSSTCSSCHWSLFHSLRSLPKWTFAIGTLSSWLFTRLESSIWVWSLGLQADFKRSAT